MTGIGIELLNDFFVTRLQRDDALRNYDRRRDFAAWNGVNVAELLRQILDVDEKDLEQTCLRRADDVNELLYEIVFFLDLSESIRSEDMCFLGVSDKSAAEIPYPPADESVAVEFEKRTGRKLRFPQLPCIGLYCPNKEYEHTWIPLELIKIRDGCASSACFWKMFNLKKKE